ncbi:MAG: RNA methyltransferase [Crocinitomicaceae bacterium]|nr:RNA methyltransferase [Crocinitomicaceae bacterium]
MSERLYHLLSEHLSQRKVELFERVASQRTRHFCLVLEDIYQAQNASAVFRSMESWGMQDLYVIENNHRLKVNQRVSKGSSNWLTVHRFANSENNSLDCINALKKKGYLVANTSLSEKAIDLSSLNIEKKTAIIMGTELSGVSDVVEKNCDLSVKIPMYGMTESLNVSVAAGVIIQYLTSRLRNSSVDWRLSDKEQLDLKIEWARKTIYWSRHIVDQYEKGLL